MPTKFTARQVTLAAMVAASGAIALPMPAFGQAVADRTLSDVKVDNVGQCTTLTVNFNIRVQLLSFFPQTSGRELHIRIRPLDAANSTALRESLRTPNSVPAVRSIEYEGDNPAGPTLSLFFTRDMHFEIEAGAQPQTLVIRLAEPGAGQSCASASALQPAVADGTSPPPAASVAGEPAAPARPAIAIPAGLYAVNVVSQPGKASDLTPAQTQAIGGQVVYETRFERDAQEWRRLRVGFFETRELAEAARARLAPQFPEAWVVKVTAEERAQGVTSRIDTGVPVTIAPVQAGAIATDADRAETAQLVATAEEAIKGNDNDRAVQLLTNALTKPENENTPRALELLGLTRERKGQSAHAQAEYDEYLRRYPSGEASDRVRQRLASLRTPATAGQSPTLRPASGEVRSAAAWAWGARGSFSQFYFRDQTSTKFVDASRPDINAEPDNSVNLNQLLTTADVTLSGGNDRRQLQIRAAGAYTFDFRTAGRDIKSLTALYVDYSENQMNLNTRIGRQTRNSAGVLGRFDGGLLSWRAKPKVKLNLVGGFPVLSSRQTYILRDRFFYGASVDVGGRSDALQTTVYWFDQRARGGFADRRSVGIEARYLKSRFNAFTIVDYDVKFKKLNLGLLTLNYSFPDTSNLSLTADYRQSPLLTTSNALIGQVDPVTFQPIRDLAGLRPFFTDPQIYQLAQDRTLVAKSLTVSYSRPLTAKLQTSVDFTLTNTGGTPASGGIAAMPTTGTEYYYGLQLVGSGMLWSNDIYILSGRYSDTQRARSYTADFNARVPITSKFRLSPRVRYGFRSDKFADSTFRQLQPTVRMNYYPMRHSEIELEVGGNFSRQKSVIGGALNTTSESGYVISAGYRVDF
jgi:hypothetical protein